MKHPALAFYTITDEPGAQYFAELEELSKRIRSVDKDHPCYINLLPNYASLEMLFGANDSTRLAGGKRVHWEVYADYVDEFIRQVPDAKILSFDFYPIHEKDGGAARWIPGSWYLNLDIFAKASQKSGLPFWAFALAIPHFSYPVPTTGELRLQQYSNLAYGAQGLQYFTYFPFRFASNIPFGPLDWDGRRTVIYDRMKVVNNEIQALAGVFLGAKLVSVHHTGKTIPESTTLLSKLPEHIFALETGDGGAVVSVLEKGNRRFLVIVNRDFQNPMTLTIVTDDKVKRVQKDATLIPASAYAPTTEVDPGDAMIYTWEK
jgi:hypothetical protein